MLCLLRTFKEEAVAEFTIQKFVNLKSEDVKAEVVQIQTRIKSFNAILNLPQVIEATKKQIEDQQKRQARMQEAAAASGIHEVGGEQ